MLGRAISVTLIGLLSSAGVQLVVATPARAYRNPQRFAAPVEDGGGGAKFFALSRAEGYGCSACHSQGAPVAVQVRGLPADGFIPSQAYRVTIDWPDDLPSVALNVELTDFEGRTFGTLLAPDPSTLEQADLCQESAALSAAQTIASESQGRRILLVGECGQAQTSFDWLAPASFAPGYFSTSIVFGNRDGKLTGDRVVDIAEALGPQGLQQPTTSLYAGACSAATVGRSLAKARDLAWLFAAISCLSPPLRRARTKQRDGIHGAKDTTPDDGRT